MIAQVYRYKGHYSPETRQSRPLRFIEAYTNAVTGDLGLPYTDTTFYGPRCVFFNTTNEQYNGAAEIKTQMLGLFSLFDKLAVEGLSFLVIDESQGREGGPKYTVNAEYMMTYWFKGDPEPVIAPRLFVFTIDESATEDGYDGLQFVDVKLYWDTDLVKSEFRKRQEAKAAQQ